MLVVLLTILLIALVALTTLFIIYSDTKNKENLPYTTLLDYLEEDKVEKMFFFLTLFLHLYSH